MEDGDYNPFNVKAFNRRRHSLMIRTPPWSQIRSDHRASSATLNHTPFLVASLSNPMDPTTYLSPPAPSCLAPSKVGSGCYRLLLYSSSGHRVDGRPVSGDRESSAVLIIFGMYQVFVTNYIKILPT